MLRQKHTSILGENLQHDSTKIANTNLQTKIFFHIFAYKGTNLNDNLGTFIAREHGDIQFL
jgi:hypothetical protein